MNTDLEIFTSELTHLVRSPFKLVSQSLFVFALIYGCQNGLDLFHKQNKEIINFKRTAGTLLLFPATLQHKVSEITKGTRYSIVTWIYKKPNILI